MNNEIQEVVDRMKGVRKPLECGKCHKTMQQIARSYIDIEWDPQEERYRLNESLLYPADAADLLCPFCGEKLSEAGQEKVHYDTRNDW